MPRATLTSRELKNKNTGIDLSVLSYKESKGLVTSTVHYQVVLVTNLACFKTPSHKDSDVVQFSFEKRMHEFEELRMQVAEQFSGTMLPPINKKSLIVNDAVLRERRNSLNQLLKFIASVSQLATCPPVLKFLGIDAVRAKDFRHAQQSKSTPAHPVDEMDQGQTEAREESNVNLFEDDDEENVDELFTDKAGAEESEATFEAEDGQPGKFRMFEEQDMKRTLTEEDEKDFSFVEDAIITKRETVHEVDGVVVAVDEEDHSKLFEIEDDLDQLFVSDVKKQKSQDKHEETSSSQTTSGTPEGDQVASAPSKPLISPKPKPAAKPSIPRKPSAGGQKPALSPKPQTATPAPRTSEGPSDVDNLDTEDIMKYLQDNANVDEGEADLFS